MWSLRLILPDGSCFPFNNTEMKSSGDIAIVPSQDLVCFDIDLKTFQISIRIHFFAMPLINIGTYSYIMLPTKLLAYAIGLTFG